jgi:hypothetical protein
LHKSRDGIAARFSVSSDWIIEQRIVKSGLRSGLLLGKRLKIENPALQIAKARDDHPSGRQ